MGTGFSVGGDEVSKTDCGDGTAVNMPKAFGLSQVELVNFCLNLSQ